MPTYSYACEKCGKLFELFATIRNYKAEVPCINCSSLSIRNYIEDLSTVGTTVRKADSELKTLGDLALRNTERMSSDEKAHLYQKHNSYKEQPEETKDLPRGMSRMKKPTKPKWPS
jgi:putative FmdB family regulatory protein